MTIEFQCVNCNNRFYVTGPEERAFNDLVDGAWVLRSKGYNNIGIGAWRVVESRAKCCHKPSIIVKKWSC